MRDDSDEDRGWNRLDIIDVRGPIAVIGDIHGRADLLACLLKKLGTMPVFVVGDVNDRGPDTKLVIELLVEREARGVRGNHEEWLCRFADGGGFDTLALNPMFGGAATLKSYGIEGRSPREVEEQFRRIPRDHRAWLLSLPVALRIVIDGAPFWIAHAGVSASLCAGIDPIPRMSEIAEKEYFDLLWRGQEPKDMDELDGPVVYGHVPRQEPIDAGHAIGIDTGCGVRPNGKLTAVILPARRFVSVGDEDL